MPRTTCEIVPDLQRPLTNVPKKKIEAKSVASLVPEQSASHVSESLPSLKPPDNPAPEALGRYTFTWTQPATYVFVTGTFDNWTKPVRLENRGGFFEKTILLPITLTEYKFVVDGNWAIDRSKGSATDAHGGVSNLLLAGDIESDRWMTIRARAAQYASGAKHMDDAEEPESYDNESIEERVARIKARVVELTSGLDLENQSSDHNAFPADPQAIPSATTGAPIVDAKENNLNLAKYLSSPATTPDHAYPIASPVSRADSITLPNADTVKLDRILLELGNEDAAKAFRNHRISDVWLPISKQTVRRILPDTQEQKKFLQLQDEALDDEIHILDTNSAHFMERACHTSLDEEEETVTEHRVLGEGACGIVEEVSISSHQGTVRCVRKRIGRPKLLQAQKKIMVAFSREVDVMRQVNHQHCVRFLGSYTDFDHVNILSSPVADMDLATLLDRPIQMKEREMLYRGFGCLCGAIHYLHQNNIRHEDLKPQNVLIHGDNILLTDFGFSLNFSDDSISTTTGRPSAWTIRYSAPEVLDFEPRNRATDIWSLGCILLEMVFGFYGTSLRDLKERWKSTGNGQCSYARNQDAVEARFLDLLAQPPDLYAGTLKVKHLSVLIRMMLREDRLQRPSAQQIVDRLSDISVLESESPEHFTATCRGPERCIGLSYPAASMANRISRVGDVEKFAKYIWPWNHPGWTFELWDLEWNPLSSDENDAAQSIQWTIYQPLLTGKQLYNVASRNGAAKDFWKAHRKESASLTSKDGKAHARSSTYMLNLKNVVFTRISLRSKSRQRDESGGTDGEMRLVQVTLLPICLPRSPFYGSFFYMLSWPTTGDDTQAEYNNDFENRIVDLSRNVDCVMYFV
jgi:serine/threonine protein kinase